jgi:DNA-binding transcriptional ArsR family regulator
MVDSIKAAEISFNNMVESSARNLDHVFQALSDSTRRSILKKVAKRERAVGEIAETYSISLAAVSKHIQSLERAGLITRRREGSYSYVRLNPDGMISADNWMSFYRAFWNDSLVSLKKFIENEES